MEKIGFIGLGVMGRSMAQNLRNAGYPLFVYNRTKEKAEPLLKAGAEWCSTPAETAAKSDIVITMVGYPHDVEEVYFGENGLLGAAKEGTILIDMTTSTPTLAKKIDEAAKAKQVKALDAPVSGGDIGAQKGNLTIMVGGEESVFEEVKPVFFRTRGKYRAAGRPGIRPAYQNVQPDRHCLQYDRRDRVGCVCEKSRTRSGKSAQIYQRRGSRELVNVQSCSAHACGRLFPGLFYQAFY